MDLTWSHCCAALLVKYSEDSFFHVVTASEKACIMPSGCRCFGKGCCRASKFFVQTVSFHIWNKIDLKTELSIRLYIFTSWIYHIHLYFVFVMPCFPFFHKNDLIKSIHRAQFTHETTQKSAVPKPGRFTGILVILGRLASQRGGIRLKFKISWFSDLCWLSCCDVF